MSVRIGQGFDVHAFDEGDHVMLGGIAIPHSHGLKAHSDGDVALHALSDALLGALALGDIGHYFPDTDPQWQGADSGQLLRAIYGSMLDAGQVSVKATTTEKLGFTGRKEGIAVQAVVLLESQ